MKRTVIISAVLFLTIVSISSGGIRSVSVFGSLGLPQGHMDYSANIAGCVRIGVPILIDPEIRLATSFASKNSDNSGRLTMLLPSVYLLGTKTFLDAVPKMSVYVSGGAGFHIMYAKASSSSGMGDVSKTSLLSKAHLFAGVDLDLAARVYMKAEGRLTYPSDIFLDAVYLGVGLRF
jgi:hypothetical protein